MIHIRVWRTMTMATVEATCHHSQEQTGGSHLVYRQSVQDVRDAPEHLLEVIADVMLYAAHRAYEDDLPGLTAECGWA